jgi:hypothetical protein
MITTLYPGWEFMEHRGVQLRSFKTRDMISRRRRLYRRSDARRPARKGHESGRAARNWASRFSKFRKYESGRNRVSVARLIVICEALEVSLASTFKQKLKA